MAGRNYTLVREDGAWSVHFPGKALMRWRDDSTVVTVVADARLSEPLLSILLAGPALSGLLIARGATLLHASAVAWPGLDPAVAGFFGPSGVGKTTMARLCAVGGRTVLSDDALRVEIDRRPRRRPPWHRQLQTSSGSPLIPAVDSARTSEDGRHLIGVDGDRRRIAGSFGCWCSHNCRESFSQVRVRPLPEVEAATCWQRAGRSTGCRTRNWSGASSRSVPGFDVSWRSPSSKFPWGDGRQPEAAQVVEALDAHVEGGGLT